MHKTPFHLYEQIMQITDINIIFVKSKETAILKCQAWVETAIITEFKKNSAINYNVYFNADIKTVWQTICWQKKNYTIY